jgi:2-polyprenyl-3-methyl-5-hydroxy-6-metoxy-1,4-benzoquinol methylase
MASIIDDRGYNQGFERTNTFMVRIERRADWFIEKMDKEDETINVLEIGAGTGEISYFIAKKTKANVIGTDICMPFVDGANDEYKLPNLKFDFLDFNHPEKLNGMKFDYIVGNGILHHLYYHLDSALVNIRALLKEDGKMIFMEPNIYNPYCFVIFNYARKWANLEPDEMAFSKSFISNKLKNAKYTKIDVSYKDFLLPNTPNFLVKTVIWIGGILEKIFPFNRVTQSIFICATK